MGNLPPGRKHLFFHRDPGTWHLHPELSARWSVNEIEDDILHLNVPSEVRINGCNWLKTHLLVNGVFIGVITHGSDHLWFKNKKTTPDIRICMAHLSAFFGPFQPRRIQPSHRPGKSWRRKRKEWKAPWLGWSTRFGDFLKAPGVYIRDHQITHFRGSQTMQIYQWNEQSINWRSYEGDNESFMVSLCLSRTLTKIWKKHLYSDPIDQWIKSGCSFEDPPPPKKKMRNILLRNIQV